MVNLSTVPEAPPTEDSVSEIIQFGTRIGHQAAAVVRTCEKLYLTVNSLLVADVSL